MPRMMRIDDFVVVADDDLHARHPLQRRRSGVVRELADVVGDDRVDDQVGVLFDLRRSLETGAQSDDHDLLELARRDVGLPR